jgi:hypothetical protein
MSERGWFLTSGFENESEKGGKYNTREDDDKEE